MIVPAYCKVGFVNDPRICRSLGYNTYQCLSASRSLAESVLIVDLVFKCRCNSQARRHMQFPSPLLTHSVLSLPIFGIPHGSGFYVHPVLHRRRLKDMAFPESGCARIAGSMRLPLSPVRCSHRVVVVTRIIATVPDLSHRVTNCG